MVLCVSCEAVCIIWNKDQTSYYFQNFEKLSVYYILYSKVLLVLSPTLLATYIFIIRNGFYRYLSFYDTQIEKLLFTAITTISVSFIIQMNITLLVRNEIAKIRNLEFKLLIDDLCRDKLT